MCRRNGSHRIMTVVIAVLKTSDVGRPSVSLPLAEWILRGNLLEFGVHVGFKIDWNCPVQIKGEFRFLRPWTLFLDLLLSKWMVVFFPCREWEITKVTEFGRLVASFQCISMGHNWKIKIPQQKSDFWHCYRLRICRKSLFVEVFWFSIMPHWNALKTGH